MTQFEDWHRGDPIEYAMALGQNGEIFTKTGIQNQVEFTDAEMQKMRDMHVLTFTHNHPGGSSLSSSDLCVASHLGIGEIRAVTTDGAYVMRGIPPDRHETVSFLTTAEVLSEQQRAEWEPKIRAGEMSITRANKEHWHQVWQKTALLPEWRDRIKYSFEPKAA